MVTFDNIQNKVATNSSSPPTNYLIGEKPQKLRSTLYFPVWQLYLIYDSPCPSDAITWAKIKLPHMTDEELQREFDSLNPTKRKVTGK
jgi:hypothetical protein